ncbi:MAG: hypothetical protein AAF604_15075 [Acidobacteriota bacterium]
MSSYDESSPPTANASAATAADLAAPDETGADLAALYRRPFELLSSPCLVVPSTKLCPGRLERNRYYLDLSDRGAAEARGDLEGLVARLAMPAAAQRELEQQLDRFAKVRFLAVGPSHGQMTYRIYLGFVGNEAENSSTAVSIDWVPTSGKFLVKTYDEPSTVKRPEQLEILRQCLMVGDDPDLGARVLESMTAITGAAKCEFQLSRARENEGRRRSVAFHYGACPEIRNRDIRESLDSLAEAFELPAAELADWLNQTDELRLTDVAAGTAWDGSPFVTVYHGFLDAPPPYLAPGSTAADRLRPVPFRGGVAESALRSEVEPAEDRGSTTTSHGTTEARTPDLAAERPVPHLALPIGRLGVAFESPARRDSVAAACGGDPEDPAVLLSYLERVPEAAGAVTFTLDQDSVPVYGLQPVGPWARQTLSDLVQRWQQQLGDSGAELAVPGHLQAPRPVVRGAWHGTLPILIPDRRGLTVLGSSSDDPDPGRRQAFEALARERRDGGASDRARALNAATVFVARAPASGAPEPMARLIADRFVIASVTAAKSAIDPSLWEVDFTSFDPRHRSTIARRVGRLTIDLGDVVPVARGPLRIWSVY